MSEQDARREARRILEDHQYKKGTDKRCNCGEYVYYDSDIADAADAKYRGTPRDRPELLQR